MSWWPGSGSRTARREKRSAGGFGRGAVLPRALKQHQALRERAFILFLCPAFLI